MGFSRRDFFKFMGLGAGAAAVVAPLESAPALATIPPPIPAPRPSTIGLGDFVPGDFVPGHFPIPHNPIFEDSIRYVGRYEKRGQLCWNEPPDSPVNLGTELGDKAADIFEAGRKRMAELKSAVEAVELIDEDGPTPVMDSPTR